MAKPTAIAYIDGFNFYHGVVKHAPNLKWLDLCALCDRLLRGYHVTHVNYFTARVKNRPNDPSQSQRQDDYLRALAAQPRINVVLGQFQRKKASVEAISQTVSLVGGGTGVLDGGQWGARTGLGGEGLRRQHRDRSQLGRKSAQHGCGTCRLKRPRPAESC